MDVKCLWEPKHCSFGKKTLTLGLDINAKGYGGEENKVSYRDTDI